MKKHLAQLALIISLFLLACTLHAEINKIEINGIRNPVISLNGTWKFSMAPPTDHWKNGVDFNEWPDIQVPGECQMQGFAIQHDQPYVYKKQFEIPDDYSGKQISLNFFGVYSYAKVWVNGTFICEHFGGFTKWSCPITDYVNAGETAILTLEFADLADDISYGSGYAQHQIGGILRDVELVALPTQNFKQLCFETELDEQYINAELKVRYELQQNFPTRIKIELLDEGLEVVGSTEEEVHVTNGTISIPVVAPKKWDAEHPNLYTVVATLLQKGKELYSVSEKIGFREVVVDGNKLLVNGHPVKLRGACRHDIHPTLGRMTTSEYDLKDVLLAKECNMNFIRTSHYPPSEAFLDYCDQYGIYVEDETAVCFVGSHRTKIYSATGASHNDPEFTAHYLSQLEEMVRNHRNHPSVIIWSIGNENVFGKNFVESYRWVKRNDPTRPVIYSYPGQVPDSLRIFEILSMHYPDWKGNLDQYNIKTKAFDYDAMPVLFDEWAHVACYNNFELKEDPNVRNFWSQSLDSMWSRTFEADGGLGGAIWCMLDETFMLPEDLPGYNQWWGILDKNVIPATYMGPCVGYGEWGIVDTWRRKKPEFWGTKKAYSPTRILVKQIKGVQAEREIRIPVHNRFDHTNFNELKITWTYLEESGDLEKFNLEPHAKGHLLIPANHWIEGEQLHIAFYQNDTMLADRYSLRLGKRGMEIPVCTDGVLELKEQEEKINIGGSGFTLDVNKKTGLIENLIMDEDTIITSGPYINLRVPGKHLQYSTIVMDDLAENWRCKEFEFEQDRGIATIHTAGSYKKLQVLFTIRIDQKGILDVEYKAVYAGKDLNIQEAGLKFYTGNTFVKLNWERDPYFTAYPDSHPGRAVGEVDLTSKPEMRYREEPEHGWEMDSRGFYYFGLEKELPYTNMVRSLKENIFTYSLLTEARSGLKVVSEGTQACRFDRIEGENTLIINDQWDYNSLLWGNYMKKLPLTRELQGHMTIALAK
ncbi:MAG: beta-galactosidase [Bacteroidetes bacterium]|nr:beta-galactosidase [Bacteroidota bacterium]